jgi:hypothetical protein
MYAAFFGSFCPIQADLTESQILQAPLEQFAIRSMGETGSAYSRRLIDSRNAVQRPGC